MTTILRIAVQVFKECVRDRVFYNLVLFAVLLIGVSLLLGQMTAGQEVKIIKDLGLAATSVFGLFIAIFIGIGLVSKEVERRSIYSVLAKPVTRTQLVLGKYVGLQLTLAVNVAIMTIALYGVLAFYSWTTPALAKQAWEGPALDPAILKASYLILVELSVVTAIAVVFSTYSSALLSAVFTFGLAVAGQFSADLKNFESIVDSRALVWFLRGIYYVLPNLASFDVKLQVVHQLPVTASYLAWATMYAAVYVGALLIIAVVIFSKRDFK